MNMNYLQLVRETQSTFCVSFSSYMMESILRIPDSYAAIYDMVPFDLKIHSITLEFAQSAIHASISLCKNQEIIIFKLISQG